MDVIQTELPYLDPIRDVLRRGAVGHQLAEHLHTNRSVCSAFNPFATWECTERASEKLPLGDLDVVVALTRLVVFGFAPLWRHDGKKDAMDLMLVNKRSKWQQRWLR